MTRGPAHDALARIAKRREEDFAGARANPGLISKVRRRRAGSAIGGAVGAVVLIGGIAFAGAMPQLGFSSSAAEQEQSADLAAGGDTVTLPVTDDFFGSAFNFAGTPAACGSPAPEVRTEQAGFTLSQDAFGPVTLDYTDAEGTGLGQLDAYSVQLTTADAPQSARVTMGYAYVQDGVVVGLTPGWGDHLITLNGDVQTVSTYSPWFGDSDCSEPGSSSPAPGTYDVYPIVNIESSREIAALEALEATGYTTRYPPDDGVFEPGSYDCGHLGGLFPRPIGCADELRSGFSFDSESSSAFVSESVIAFADNVEVSLVGEPFQVTVVGSADDSFARQYVSQQPPNTGDLSCGPVPRKSGDGSPLPDSVVYVEIPVEELYRSDFAETTDVTIDLVDPARTGSVTYPDGVQAWFIDFDYFADAGRQPKVIGTARVDVNIGGAVQLDAYAGPSSASALFTSIEWCADPGQFQEIWVYGREVSVVDGVSRDRVALFVWGRAY